MQQITQIKKQTSPLFTIQGHFILLPATLAFTNQMKFTVSGFHAIKLLNNHRSVPLLFLFLLDIF